MRIKVPGIVKRIYPDMVWSIDDPEGLYLTFDDGPTAQVALPKFVGSKDKHIVALACRSLVGSR